MKRVLDGDMVDLRAIEERWAGGRPEQLPALAAELVCLSVDVLVGGGNQAIEALRHATSTIPIVMAVSSAPVGMGLVASLARPGGNITGVSIQAAEVGGKRLELLKEAVPRRSRVGSCEMRPMPARRPNCTTLRSRPQP
jgi:putative ABC transport system substrate-binding protein